MAQTTVPVVLSRQNEPFPVPEDEEPSPVSFRTELDNRDGRCCTIPECGFDASCAIDYCHIVPGVKEDVVCSPFTLLFSFSLCDKLAAKSAGNDMDPEDGQDSRTIPSKWN